MKFARHLSAHLTPEWYAQYINYDKMKSMLYQVKNQCEAETVENIEAFFRSADVIFLDFCQRELVKIENFYSEKLAEAKRKLSSLVNALDEHDYAGLGGSLSRDTTVSASAYPFIKKDKNRLAAAKLAFSELYLLLVLIQNYQNLNVTGFRKILKKHDKLFNTDRGNLWHNESVLGSKFAKDSSIDGLIEEVEQIFTFRLENGNKQAAMRALRVPPLNTGESALNSFRVGILLGMIVMATPIIVMAGFWIRKNIEDVPWVEAVRLYRPMFMFIVHICLAGLNVIVWNRSGVNHVLIFELDPRRHLNYQQLLEVGFSFFFLFELSLMSFLLCSYYNCYALLNPIILLIVFIILLATPSRFLYWHARKWLLLCSWQIFFPCLRPVQFRHFWLGDQLTSQTTSFADSFHFLFFYTVQYPWLRENRNQTSILRPALSKSAFYYTFLAIFSILPHLARFEQCLRRYYDSNLRFPHVPNAGKYLSSFPVVLMQAVRPKIFDSSSNAKEIALSNGNQSHRAFNSTYVLLSFVESTYKLIWDLKMDWGLMKPNFQLLRETTVYGSHLWYYAAISENVILRYAWLVVWLLRPTLSSDSELVKSIVALLEICRRFIWNFFRLENEHLNNCGQFRAIRDIGVQPLHKKSLRKRMTKSFGTVYSRQLAGFGVRPASTTATDHQRNTIELCSSERSADGYISPSPSANSFEDENSFVDLDSTHFASL